MAAATYSNTTPVRGSVTAAGVTDAVTGLKDSVPSLVLTGGTSAAGYAEYSPDFGTNWTAYTVEGTQLGTFSYIAATYSQTIGLPLPTQPNTLVRVRFTAVSGTVSYTLSQ